MDLRSLVIVIPTYNERKNLSGLVKEIFKLNLSSPLSIIVVDDNSPDGTGRIADALAKENRLSVIHRPKKLGLGTAYRDAFISVLRDTEKADYIIQMDSDFSHHPKDIPRMLEKIKQYDVVLGSRYVKGGSVENWGIMRRFISLLSNVYVRLVLRVPVYDMTGGFKCWRRNVLENIDLENLSSIGYNFQIETTYKAHKKGFKICEIPIIFTERTSGKSKFNLPIILESFWKVLKLKLQDK